MDIKQLQQAIANITIWKKGDQRAPHKPLLLLYVLSQYKQGHERLFDYGTEIQQPLLELLNSFGPDRKTHYPNMPFWRLKGDGFWQLNNAENCTDPKQESKEPTSNRLIECGVQGGFDEQAYKLVINKPKQIDKLAQRILSELLPEGEQDRLANQLGFDLAEINRERNPKFRQTVLRAYNYQCAVCGYNLKQDCTPVGLEAAHVKWKQFGGPCEVDNGLALCSIHHSAFDMGAIGLNSGLKLLVSSGVNGNEIVDKLFWNFEGKSIFIPKEKKDWLQNKFVEWHHEQVFKK
ncbi:phosphorothioated DNA-binding restriction endonuclease [Zophobihabitans entericus]|uniref:Restriction endonuclease n=1 Tax=Zophobihabitans entericus TaxID=1635327 RepID=A0A6G9I9X2_9GAMM|nr:HNH endonuclease [Zophobihabitans entericus]QIQ21013.1 restriction endonuclease [Zophobihabitans entericus]